MAVHPNQRQTQHEEETCDRVLMTTKGKYTATLDLKT